MMETRLEKAQRLLTIAVKERNNKEINKLMRIIRTEKGMPQNPSQERKS